MSISVRTQTDFDSIPLDYDGIIEIRDTPEMIKIDGRGAIVVALDNSAIDAHGHSNIEAKENSVVIAHDDSYVDAYDNSLIEAYGNSKVIARMYSHIIAYGHSTVDAYGHSTVEARENSVVTGDCKSIILAYDNSRVNLREDPPDKSYLVIHEGNGYIVFKEAEKWKRMK